jgi:hypothetical protein
LKVWRRADISHDPLRRPRLHEHSGATRQPPAQVLLPPLFGYIPPEETPHRKDNHETSKPVTKGTMLEQEASLHRPAAETCACMPELRQLIFRQPFRCEILLERLPGDELAVQRQDDRNGSDGAPGGRLTRPPSARLPVLRTSLQVHLRQAG